MTEKPRLYGTDNSWRPATTSLQRERAAAPFEKEPSLEAFAIKAACWMCVVLFVFCVVSFAG